MGFIIGVVAAFVVVFLLSYLTIKDPKVGKIEISLVLILIALVVFLYFHEDDRVEKHKSLIPVSEIKLSNIEHQWAYGAYYKLTAKLSNLSPRYRLQSITLKVSFYNCPEDKTQSDFKDCELVNTLKHTIRTFLDAQKTKNIEAYLLLNDDLLGDLSIDKLRWKVEVDSGLAR